MAKISAAPGLSAGHGLIIHSSMSRVFGSSVLESSTSRRLGTASSRNHSPDMTIRNLATTEAVAYMSEAKKSSCVSLCLAYRTTSGGL